MFFSKLCVHSSLELIQSFGEHYMYGAYSSHQFLWKLFDDNPDAERDFLFRQDEMTHKGLVWYIVSKRKPLIRRGISLEVKNYNPVIKNGDKFLFSLRANPVVSKKVDGRGRNYTAHHDVLMDAKKQGVSQGFTGIELDDFINKRAMKWIIERSEKCGFHCFEDKLSFEGYQQHRFKKGRSHQFVQFSSVDYGGILEVTHSDQFLKSLFEGVGRSRAFGCGLMMIKRV